MNTFHVSALLVSTLMKVITFQGYRRVESENCSCIYPGKQTLLQIWIFLLSAYLPLEGKINLVNIFAWTFPLIREFYHRLDQFGPMKCLYDHWSAVQPSGSVWFSIIQIYCTFYYELEKKLEYNFLTPCYVIWVGTINDKGEFFNKCTKKKIKVTSLLLLY